MQYDVRPPDPRPADAPEVSLDDPLVQALAHVHVTGWRQAYGDLLPERYYDEAARADRARMWQSTLMHDHASDRVRIAARTDRTTSQADSTASQSDTTVSQSATPASQLDSTVSQSATPADDEVIGFSIHGPARDDDRTGTELFALYVLQEHYGSGAGQRLLDAAIGDSPACLWAAAENPRALRFYEKNGFRPDGVRRTDADADGLEEIRLVRE